MRIKREIDRCLRIAFCALVVNTSGCDARQGAVICCLCCSLTVGAARAAAVADACGVGLCSGGGSGRLVPGGLHGCTGGGCLRRLLGAGLGLGRGLGLGFGRTVKPRPYMNLCDSNHLTTHELQLRAYRTYEELLRSLPSRLADPNYLLEVADKLHRFASSSLELCNTWTWKQC